MVITSDNLEAARWILYIFAFLFGAAWGSFLNVVIYRVPAGLSVVKPASRCPHCETPIRAWDNIPILSWFILGGKCRACKAPFSIRYALIELLVGLLTLALAYKIFHERLLHAPIADLLVPFFFLFLFIAALVALFFIDLDITELPPEITIPGIFVGLAYAWLVPEFGAVGSITPNVDVADALIGTLMGGGIIFGLFSIYFILTGRVGMGGGDLWMMAFVGSFVGWQGLLFIFLASSVQGLVVAFTALALGAGQQDEDEDGLFRNKEVAEIEAEIRKEEGKPELEEDEDAQGVGKLAVPFGPFIALSAVEYLFLGHIILPLLTGGTLGPNGFLWIADTL